MPPCPTQNAIDPGLPLLGNFPPPTTPEELGARILIQERYEKFGESEEVEMEVESDEEDEKQEKAEEPPSQLDQDTQVQDMDEVNSPVVLAYLSPRVQEVG